MAGWRHCPGRHTVTGVAVAAGVVGGDGERSWRPSSVFHRCFSRARWDLDAVGKVVFTLALRLLPAGCPLIVLVDDRLARKAGKAIALGSMHHDPRLSHGRKTFRRCGQVWVVLAVWLPLPFGVVGGPRGVAVPLLCRRYVGRKAGHRQDAPSRPTSGKRYQQAHQAFPLAPAQRPPKPALAREASAVVAGWAAALAPERTVSVVGDTGDVNETTVAGRPANVEVSGPLRLDGARWTPPPPRHPGQKGRPRQRGERLPTPAAQVQARQHWHALPVTRYGRTVRPLVFRGTALWYRVLPTAPLRDVVVRDPSGRRKAAAFCCTDLTVSVACLLETYATRWTLEVTCFLLKGRLGFDAPQNQTVLAGRRTAPFAGIVFALIVRWYATALQAGRGATWVVRPWYRRKAAPSFADVLTTRRRAGLTAATAGHLPIAFFTPPCQTRRQQNSRVYRHPPRCLHAHPRASSPSRPPPSIAPAPA
ncbi:MAG: transposase [Chloroflexi bacterium]|nr:transposase [Chloroflexota bacterium]